MKVYFRPLNSNEIFPCSVRKAKEIFKDTEVDLNFAYGCRIYGVFANTPPAFYLKNKIKGRVIATITMYPRVESININFFVIKAKDYNAQLQKEFEEKYLMEFYRLYESMLNDSTLNNKGVSMLVELIDGKLKLHVVRD